MKRSGRSSPVRLALWAGLASAFSIAYLLIATISIERLKHCSVHAALGGRPLWILAYFTPFLGSVAISLLAASRLRKGVKNLAYSEEALASARKGLGHPVWKVLGVAGLGAYIALIAVNSHHAFLVYISMLPLQTLMRLYQDVTPKTGMFVPLSLMTASPLRSEHWGHGTGHPDTAQ